MTTIPRVLSIAGTDPSGGAGIHADLKSIAAHGGYGMAAVTALTAQNTQGVRSVHAPDVVFLAQQLDAVSDDIEIDAVKIGMLFNEEIIETVQQWLGRVQVPLVVLDPVMVSTSGDSLLSAGADRALAALMNSVDLVTPNVPELALLLSLEANEVRAARTVEELEAQGKNLARRYGVRVLAKGGHLSGESCVDLLIDEEGGSSRCESPRIQSKNTHGTGCSLSAAMATLAASGHEWPEALHLAKSWLTRSIRDADALHVGQGHGPISHFSSLWNQKQPGQGRDSESELLSSQPSLAAEEVARQWWEQIAPIREKIDQLPFIKSLRDGTLEKGRFLSYLAQDAVYLKDYSRALAAASQMAPTPEEQGFWAEGARGAILAETELHAAELLEAGAAGEDFFQTPSLPVTDNYTNHLLAAAARGNYGELIAALLPCYWIYDDVGRALLEHLSESEDGGASHPYRAWIGTYGDPEFAQSAQRAVSVVTRYAARASAREQQMMFVAFEKSSLHELHFFDGAQGR